MKLAEEEQRMLQGEFGDAVQQSMELQVALGEAYGAEKMAKIYNVHITQGGVISAGKAGLMYVQELADKGGKFVVDATINPGALDFSMWQELGTTKECFNNEAMFCDAYNRLGVIMSRSCTPYQLGNVPRMGEHIVWSESSAVIFANSVLGARTNREAAPSCIAAAITGRVPLYGYHLDENRHGDVKVIVSASLEDLADYSALGHFTGKFTQTLTPVFEGIPPGVTTDQLKHIGATLSGATLFHVIGITPEAKTEEQAFGNKRPGDSDIMEFGEKELLDTTEELSPASEGDIDVVFLGCPHASINEIKEIAELLSGRILHSSVGLWIFTSVPVKAYGENAGYNEVIEKAGGKIICETCPMCWEKDIPERLGYHTLATNSSRGAIALWNLGKQIHFGSTKKCIEAAVNGVWR